MKKLIAIGLGAVLALSSAATAPAHLLKSLEEQLHKREKYFQAFNKEAPVFALRDAAGRTISSSELRGKVVVLNLSIPIVPMSAPCMPN
ncbi:MAG: SCO family protein, partial [Alphaproteobacteria bacterium]